MARRRSSRPRPGATVLREVRKALAKGWPPGLTVLTGEDIFHLDAAQKALLEHLVPEDASGFALTVLGEGKTETAELVAAARSSPMFAPRRVVLLRDISVLEGDPGPLSGYAESPPSHSYLLVRADKLDLRRPLHKTLYGGGQLLEFGVAEPGGSPEQLRELGELARVRGLELDRAAALLLLEVCAGDLYRVQSELDKLEAWLAGEQEGERRVNLEAVREVTSGGGALSGWEVADAVLERDLEAAYRAVRRFVEAGEEPIRLVGGLAWRSRGLIQAKAMQESKASGDQVVAAARAWSYKDRFLKGLSRYTLKELGAFPAILLAADRRLKSRSLDSLSVLESLVRDLTQKGGSER